MYINLTFHVHSRPGAIRDDARCGLAGVAHAYGARPSAPRTPHTLRQPMRPAGRARGARIDTCEHAERPHGEVGGRLERCERRENEARRRLRTF